MNEESIQRSIAALKSVLTDHYGAGIELYLYGSVARKDYEHDSDIDILVLFPGDVDNALTEEVIDLAYDVELACGVVFGIVVHSKTFWNSPKAAVMPFHENVTRESLRI